MQICDVIIRISEASNATTTTVRHNVTPAEVRVLRFIKGENTVLFNGNLRSVQRSSQAEVNRLVSAHGDAFYKVFAVGAANLPLTFAEAPLDTSRIIEVDPYVPAPDEAQLLEVFTEDDIAPVTTDAPPLVDTKKRKTSRKTEDFS